MTTLPIFVTREDRSMNAKKIEGHEGATIGVEGGGEGRGGRKSRWDGRRIKQDPARIPEWQMVFSRIMIAARLVSYIVEYTAPVWYRRHVDSRPRRAIHPPISPYHKHPPRISLVRPLNGRAKPPPWCSIIDTYPSRCLELPAILLRASPAIAVWMHFELEGANAKIVTKFACCYIK